MIDQRSQAEDVADGFFRIADMLGEHPIPGIRLIEDQVLTDVLRMPPGWKRSSRLASMRGDAEQFDDDGEPPAHERRQSEGSPAEHLYTGIRANDNAHDTQVLVDGLPLPITELARRKSPSGFEWGYGGSGPAALAHSLLAYEFGEEAADRIPYQDFKWTVVATLDYAGWTLTSSQIRAAVELLSLPTIEQAFQESPQQFADDFTETVNILTQPKHDPIC